MKRFILTLLCVAGFAATHSYGQQDPRFTHYFYNQQYFNPAYAGLDGNIRGMLLGRTQWLGYNNDGGSAPNTGLLSVSAPLLRANSGVGLVVYYENYAATTALSAKVNYAYHLNLGGGKLSIGVNGGFGSIGKDANKYRPIDITDQSIPASSTNSQFDLGAGLYYRTAKYFVGVSGQHLNRPIYRFGGAATTPLDRHYYGIAGYNFELSPTITLTPSVLFKTANFIKKASSVEGNVTANFNNRFSAGLGYTQGEAANILIGLSLLKDNSLRLGYAVDLITQGVDAKQSSSHELMLAYVLPVTLKAPKPAIRTPRYRK